MLDIKYVREHLDEVAETMKNRHASFDPEQFTALDVQRREVIAEEEALQAERNKPSKSIGALMGQGKTDEANATKETRPPDQREAHRPRRCPRRGRGRHGRAHAAATPNMPAVTTPVGEDENDNPEVRRWGTPRDFAAEGFETAAALGFGAGPGHHRLRARREARRAAASRAGRPRRPSRARAHQLHGRHAHLARLQGVVVPGHGQRRHAHRHGPAAEVRGGPVPHHRGPVPHPHGRGAAHQHPRRRGARRRPAAAASTARSPRASARRRAAPAATPAGSSACTSSTRWRW